jgi:geranylgeranyl transferase type-2 subunit beta
MSDSPFLFRLAERLHDGAERLPSELKSRCRDAVLREQKDDGGWGGREGDSDLYYTSFAIRSLTMLDAFEGAPVDRSAGFLKANATTLSNIVDLLSWLYSALAVGRVGGPMLIEDVGDDWSAGVATWLDGFRTSDGGFGKSVGATAGSTYHTFLALLCLDMLGGSVADSETIRAFFAARQRDDGGFVEIPQVKLSGVNPTAAALVGWSLISEIPEDVRTAAAEYLESVVGDEGGFQANSRIPFADGLSTFTGLLATQEAKLGPILDPKKAAAFIGELAAPDGGFHGASWDRKVDVEYTFYGLGTLALLAERH